jgi:hypothetical protein
MDMEKELRQSDKDILRGLNHKLVDTPKVEVPEMNLDDVLPPPATPKAASPKAPPPNKKEPKEEGRTENRVLTQLRQTFGLEKIKRADVMFNSMVFTLKAISASWLSWADSYALLTVVDKAGNFNRLEYEATFKVYLASCYIEKIDGLSVTEVFGEEDEKAARIKLAHFLINESSDLLGKKIFEAYDDQIEPYAKITSGLEQENENLATYECPKCNNVMPYEKQDKPYFCHKDGTKMRPFKMEDNLPLP